MPTTQDLNRYAVASRFLQEGRRDWVLVLVGELLQSATGRPYGLQLLAEMYRKMSDMGAADEELAMPAPEVAAAMTAVDQGVWPGPQGDTVAGCRGVSWVG